MTLSPLERLTWLLQVTRVQPALPAGVLRVAIWLAEQARDGRMVYSIDAVAEQTCLHYNTTQRALADLVRVGFLTIEQKATQRHHAHYAMLRVTTEGDAKYPSESPRKVTLERPRVTTASAQGHLGPRPRVTSEGDLQEDARGLEEAERAKPQPSLPEDAFAKADQSAAPKRRYTVGDLQACHSVLIIFRDDRDTAETLLTLYGWEACNRGIAELTPAAKARPHNKQRVTISELRTWLGSSFELEAEDYRRAGLTPPVMKDAK